MAEDLVTLGFSFTAGNAENEITRLISAFNQLEEKSDKVQNITKKMFGAAFLIGIDAARKSLGKLNGELVQTAALASSAVSAMKPLSAQMTKISGDRVKPVSPIVLDSLRIYSTTAKEAAESISQLKISPAKFNSDPVSKLGREMGTTARSADDLTNSLRQMFISGTAALYFRKATMAAIDFEQELVYTQTLERNFNVDKIRSGILNMSSVYGSSAEIAKSYYIAVSSGIRSSEQATLDFTNTASKAAVLIRSDVPTAVDAMTSAMNAYGMSAREAGRAGDVLFKIVDYGKANGQQLANSFGQITSTAVTAGVKLEELGASIATLTKVIPTRNAITFLNNALSKMIRPTKESRLAAEELGVEFGLSAIKAKGFGNVMLEVFEAGKKNQEALLRLFPDLRGQRAMLQLLGKGWGDYQNAIQEFSKSSGAMDRSFEVLNNSLYVQLDKIPNTLNKVMIATGEMLVNIFTLGGALTPVIKAFNEMGETGQKVFGALTLVVGGFAALKTAQTVWHAMQAMEIRNNAILSAQRKKEVLERNAVTAAIVAESSAKTGGTISGTSGGSTAALKQNIAVNAAAAQMAAKVAGANLVRARSELLTARNVMRSAYMTKIDTAAKLGGLSASRWNLATAADLSRAEIANAAFKRAAITVSLKKKAMLDAETAAIIAQTAALKANSAASAFSSANTIGSVAKTGVGLSGGFKAMFDTASFTASMKTSGTAFKQLFSVLKGNLSVLGAVTTGFTGLKIALTGFGAMLGKAATALAGIFTATNVIIAGAVLAIGGLLDIGQSLIRGKGWYDGTVLLKPFSEWLVGVGKLQEQAKLIDESLATSLELLKARKAIRNFAKDIQDGFKSLWDEELVTPRQTPAEKMKNYLGQFASEANNYSQKYNDARLKSAQYEAERARDAYDWYLGTARKIWSKGGQLDEQSQADLERYKNAWEKANEALNEIQSGSKESGGKMRQYASQMQELVRAQMDALNAIRELAKKQQFSMLSPEKQMERLLSAIATERDNYYKAMKNGDAAAAKTAFSSMLDAHNAVVKDAQSKIKEFSGLGQNLDSDYYDAQLNSTKHIWSKIFLMRGRSNEIQTQVGQYLPQSQDFDKNWGKRSDGMWKNTGWRGVIKTVSGGVMTELSSEIDGIKFPTIIPSTTDKEIQTILESLESGMGIPKEIVDKAYKFAQDRIDQGKSPFYNGDKADSGLINQYQKTEDLTKAYETEKRAISLQIQAMQEEINFKNKLAQAEKSANENTWKLIQSMDKFSATTVNAVSTNSVQAMELQSRRFNQLPKFNPSTQAQAGLGESQGLLNYLYKQQMEMIAKYQKLVDARQQEEETRRTNAEKNLNEFLSKNGDSIDRLEKAMTDATKALQDAANKISQGDNSAAMKSSLEKIANHFSEISVVTY